MEPSRSQHSSPFQLNPLCQSEADLTQFFPAFDKDMSSCSTDSSRIINCCICGLFSTVSLSLCSHYCLSLTASKMFSEKIVHVNFIFKIQESRLFHSHQKQSWNTNNEKKLGYKVGCYWIFLSNIEWELNDEDIKQPFEKHVWKIHNVCMENVWKTMHSLHPSMSYTVRSICALYAKLHTMLSNVLRGLTGEFSKHLKFPSSSPSVRNNKL